MRVTRHHRCKHHIRSPLHRQAGITKFRLATLDERCCRSPSRVSLLSQEGPWILGQLFTSNLPLECTAAMVNACILRTVSLPVFSAKNPAYTMNPTTRSAWLRLPYVLLVSSLFVVPTSHVLSEDSEQEKSVKKLYQFAWTPSERAAAGEAFWPQFRGPQGDGSAFDAKPPTEWSETKNLVWKTAIHGQAWSSPVVWKDRIWMTTATADGKTMSVICCDLNTGKILLDRVVFTNQEVQKDHHATNSYSSPTPVMDSERVYLHWGAYGTAALNAKTGETLWNDATYLAITIEDQVAVRFCSAIY